ncbi:hypothetical protein [Pseudoalteromonas piscicida]|uniref:hypothetical protein n=1 Tax=Pseudoalteromonas piscicida TaxID=43662 RepID=UPI001CB7308D|nr:hypothetical protein [Pseudoalteromonas piscicida]
MDIIELDEKAFVDVFNLPEKITIKVASTADIEEMALVTKVSWQAAFSGFLPEHVLKGGPSNFSPPFGLRLSKIQQPKAHYL